MLITFLHRRQRVFVIAAVSNSTSQLGQVIRRHEPSVAQNCSKERASLNVLHRGGRATSALVLAGPNLSTQLREQPSAASAKTGACGILVGVYPQRSTE